MQRYSTLNLEGAREKARYWREICAEVFCGLEVRPHGDGAFDNELEYADIGAIRLSRACSMPATIVRSKAGPDGRDEDLFFLHLQSDGDMLAEHCGREAALRAGDLVLCEGASPYRLRLGAPSRTVIMTVPSKTLRAHLHAPQDALGRKLDGRIGVGSLVSGLMLELWRQSAELEAAPPDIAARVSCGFLDLLAAALSEALGARASESAARSARRAQIARYIEQNLSDPDFSPRRIAAALHASERYVRKLFEDEEESIMERVLRRRLEECARQLRDPMRQRHTVSEIAFSWGFNSPSHFSRAFKARFGLSPLEYRRNALA